MLGHAPISSTPICALPQNSLGYVTIVGEAILEARFTNPLVEIIDPRNQVVFALEIRSLPVG